MNKETENKVKALIEDLKSLAVYDMDFQRMDPVVKMMLVAVAHEIEKIEYDVNQLAAMIEERYCSHFIPWKEMNATPAIALVLPEFRSDIQFESVEEISDNFSLSFPLSYKGTKRSINFSPLFKTKAFPNPQLVIRTDANKLWIGITTKAGVESLDGMTLLIKGTHGVNPEHVYIGENQKELNFATISEMERIRMLPPLDSVQQASDKVFAYIENWKNCLLCMDEAVWLCVTDEKNIKDFYIERGDQNTLWLQLVFPDGFVVPDDCIIQLNVIPVVNIDKREVSLTENEPIINLLKGKEKEDSFFVDVLKPTNNEFVIRDFDANCYNPNDFFRDVRNLYNRFVNDYYAFKVSNEIKSDDKLEKLRQDIENIGKDAPENSLTGVYAMKNKRHDIEKNSDSATVNVEYIITQGAKGNAPRKGQDMENKKNPSFKPKVSVVVSAIGGANKTSADGRREALRYYALTNDRLYTKKDIDAYLREKIKKEFGETAFNRIRWKMSIEGAGGSSKLQRGLYVDIEFYDKKDYESAQSLHFDALMQQGIRNKSCISMPIIVKSNFNPMKK